MAAVLLTVAASSSHAVTIRVDHAGGGDYLTIQEGIDAATYGDTVLVAPGTYNEHIYIGAPADGVTLLGESGAASTIVDGQEIYGESVITCEDVGADTRIEGLTVTGGVSHYWGGGIGADHADIRVSACIIKDNEAPRLQGGGIGCNDSNVEIIGCVFEGNWGGEGGAIGLWDGTAVIKSNEIARNRAVSFTADESGGGISAAADYVEICDNTISDNEARFGGAVGTVGAGTLIISGNTMSENTASASGGALFLRSVDAFTVTQNIVVGNSVGVSGSGAALRVFGEEGTQVHGSSVVDNVFFGNRGTGDQSAIVLHKGGPLPEFHGNFLVNETAHEVRATSTPWADTLDFTGNWWGTSDPLEIADRIWDCADDSELLWCIDFSGWCDVPDCSGQTTDVPEATQQVTSWGRLKSLYR